MFITNRADHKVTKYPLVNQLEGTPIIQEYIKKTKEYSLDFETPNLKPLTKQTLLCSINNHIDDYCIVIDTTSVPLNEVLSTELLKGKTLIAHHAKFEVSWLKTNGIEPDLIYCTMITDQKLTQGSGFKNNLIAVAERRKVEIPLAMDKDVRLDFIDADISIVFEDRHIDYSIGDVLILNKIKEEQLKIISKWNMNFLIEIIHMPLIKILAQMELNPFIHNSNKLRNYLKELETEINTYFNKLNEKLKDIDIFKVRPDLIEAKEKKERKIKTLKSRIFKNTEKLLKWKELDKIHLKSYKITKEVTERALEELNKTLNSEMDLSLNWKSSQQVLSFFSEIGINPLPTDKEKSSIGKEARTSWLSENKDSPHYEVVSNFDEYKKLEHNYNNFGEKWIEKYVQEDGKVYTTTRQVGTDTGRFASGNKDHGFYNGQQIPTYTNSEGIEIFRDCFETDPGRSLVPSDYTGCELVLMISLSGDLKLKEISELEDQHSYLGTKSYRNLYQYRYNKTKNPKDLELSKTFTMSKETREAKEFRAKYKNTAGAFPTVYGVHNKKVSQMLGVTRNEADILLNTVKNEMPVVIDFVESKVKELHKKGYVVHNKRTNSIRIFPKVLESIIEGTELKFMDRISAESQAKNTCIQGSNADIIAEAMVLISKWININHLDIRFMLQVHDDH